MPNLKITPFPFTGYKLPVSIPSVLKSFAPEKVAAVPSKFITDIGPLKEVQNVMNQLQIPSCVAHAVTLNVMYHYWKQTGQYVKLSPRFVYALCKVVDGLPPSGGTYLETALNIVKQYGVCEDSYFPNDTTLNVNTYTNASLIPQAAKDNALKYKIDSFEFLSDLSQTGLNTAMYNDGAGDMVMVGMEISDAWWTDVNGNTSWSADALLPLRPVSVANPYDGGHLTNLYAEGAEWDSQNMSETWGLNEWGPAWAYNGRYCFGSNDLPNIHEAATLTATFPPTTTAPQAQVVAQPSIIEEVIDIVEKII